MEVNELKPLRRRLKELGIKQKHIAARIGVSESNVSRLLRGRVALTLSVMEAIREEIVSRSGSPATLDELFSQRAA